MHDSSSAKYVAVVQYLLYTRYSGNPRPLREWHHSRLKPFVPKSIHQCYNVSQIRHLIPHRGAESSLPVAHPGRVSGHVGHFVQTWPDSECSHTVQFLVQFSDCSTITLFLLDSAISSSSGITCFGTVWPFWCWCAEKLWYNQKAVITTEKRCFIWSPAISLENNHFSIFTVNWQTQLLE